ncbi:MAG TPA: AraC family ligand binding domain-containing protein, partial [Thermoanaerobaculia bacterium]|nr:AraC family ligand binding domain-containing protein [Thermoanaerobaculia bacterium]
MITTISITNAVTVNCRSDSSIDAYSIPPQLPARECVHSGMPHAAAATPSERVLRTVDASGFVLTEKLFPARGRLAEHAHDNAHFCFVVEGRYTESHQRQRLECAPSTLTFRPGGELHHNEFHDEPVQVLTLEIPPRWIARVEEESIALPQALSFRDGLVSGLARRLANEFRRM